MKYDNIVCDKNKLKNKLKGLGIVVKFTNFESCTKVLSVQKQA